MDISLRLLGDSAANELQDLGAWLAEEDELRGRASPASPALQPDEMGGITDTLIIALGTQGTGAVLATAMSTWIKHRRPSADIEVSREGRKTVKISLRDADPATVDTVLRKALEP